MITGLRIEMIEIIKQSQDKWKNEMKTMIKEIRNNNNNEEKERTHQGQQTPQIILDLKEEFKTMITENNNEWKNRLQQQKQTEEEWDKRMTEQHKETIDTIEGMMNSIKNMFKTGKETMMNNVKNIFKTGKTIVPTDDTTNNHGTRINENDPNKNIKSKIDASKTTIKKLKEQLQEQKKELLANTKRVTREMKQQKQIQNE